MKAQGTFMSVLAAVTGATGLIGRRIVDKLVERGAAVRVLTRRDSVDLGTSVQVCVGDLRNSESLRAFLGGVKYVFHCAAEIKNESLMESINVTGTRNIVSVSNDLGVEVFCHLSSVGVTGLTAESTVDELTPCSPQNHYERTKLVSEAIVTKELNARKVMLRPTNVVSESSLGVLSFLKLNSTRDYAKALLKGRELAHIVHVDDVAWSAMHLAFGGHSGCYIVSTDDQPGGEFGEILSAAVGKTLPYCPSRISGLLRSLLRGPSNAPNIRYSAQRLTASGFEFEVGLDETIRRVSSSIRSRS